MTDESPQELAGLGSSSPSERARAAAWLVQNPDAVTARDLMRALQAENVPRLRKVLLTVLELRQKSSTSSRDGSAFHGRSDRRPSQVAPASDQTDIASLIRHELSPAVGWIRLAADSEISSFPTSRTNEAVRKLQRRIDGLVALIKAEEDLHLRRFSLPHVLAESWPDPNTVPIIDPEITEQPIEIETDEGLFSILISNVYQNAIDASTEAVGEASAQVAWGVTEKSFWVRVANPFKGDRFVLNDVIDLGNSSKITHQGRGLALIRSAADRLGIVFDLQGVSGTAIFSFSGKRFYD